MVPSSSPAEPSYTAVSPGKEICSEYNRAFLICLKAAMLLEWGRWACSERCFFKEALCVWRGVGGAFSETTIVQRLCHAKVYFIPSYSSLILPQHTQHITDRNTRMSVLREVDKCLLQGLSWHLCNKPSFLEKLLELYAVSAALLDMQCDLGCKRVSSVSLHLKHWWVIHVKEKQVPHLTRPFWGVFFTPQPELAAVTPGCLAPPGTRNKVLLCLHSRHFSSL